VHDAGELGRVEGAAGVQVHHHRGGGLLLVAQEGGLLGDRQMHAGAGDAGDGRDGARQLAFEGALEVDLLVELGDAELLVLHQLEAHQAALRDALGGHAQAQVVDLVGGHQDRVAVVGELVGHVLLLQAGHHGAAVLFGEVGEQHGVVGLAAPQDHADHQRNGEGQRRAGRDLLALRQIADVFQHLREG
jgi:hypothetical protein